MNDNESFADYPKSITELRAEREENGDKQTVRDCLIAALRDLDSGNINPEGCIVLMHWSDEEGSCNMRYFQKTRTAFERAGMLHRALRELT